MNRRPGLIGLLFVVAVGWAVAWGIYHLMLVGSCSTPAGPGEVPCPPGTLTYVGALTGGIILGVVGSIVTANGAFVFLSVFTGIGVGAIMAGINTDAPDTGWYFFFAACFLLTPAMILLSLPFAGLKRMRAARLLANGIEAKGTVLSVQDTGVTINNNPRVRMRFRLEPVDGYPAPYESEKTATVPRVALPRVGDTYAVWIDRDDPDKWMFAAGAADGTPATNVKRILELARHGASPTVPPPQGQHDVVRELSELNEMRMSGAISADEFANRTSEIINAQSAPTG